MLVRTQLVIINVIKISIPKDISSTKLNDLVLVTVLNILFINKGKRILCIVLINNNINMFR